MLQYLNVNRTVSKHFLFRFLETHSNFMIRKQKSLIVNRQNAHDIEIIHEIFRLFKATREKYNILKKNICNMNETSFKIDIDENQYIVTRTSHRKFTIKNSNNRESFINIEIIRDDDTILFSYIILNDKQYMKK